MTNGHSEQRQDLSAGDLADDGGQLNPQQGGRCPEGQIWDAERQACVQRGAHLDGQKPKKPRRRADDDTPTPLGNRGSPGHVDPFLDDELGLAGVLSRRSVQLSDGSIIPLYEQAFQTQSLFDFESATEEAIRVWGARAFDGPTLDATEGIVESVLVKGEVQIARGALAGAPSRQLVLDGMVSATQYRTNQFFNTQVVPALQREIEKMFDATDPMAEPDLTPIRETLNRRLKSVPYWRVVANAAASRGYHYGYLKAAQLQNRRSYRLVAVIDSVTSKICQELDGREFHLADATVAMERVAGSENQEEVKNLMPWPKLADVQGQSSDALRERGVLVPPFHGNCRTTLVPF